MKLTTVTFAEHRSAGEQDVIHSWLGAQILVPGASTCCDGSSSTSSCSCSW